MKKHHYILLNYAKDIDTSISWVSCTYVFFTSPIQLVNGAQLLIITFLLALFKAATVPVFGIAIAPLSYMCS